MAKTELRQGPGAGKAAEQNLIRLCRPNSRNKG